MQNPNKKSTANQQLKEGLLRLKQGDFNVQVNTSLAEDEDEKILLELFNACALRTASLAQQLESVSAEVKNNSISSTQHTTEEISYQPEGSWLVCVDSINSVLDFVHQKKTAQKVAYEDQNRRLTELIHWDREIQTSMYGMQGMIEVLHDTQPAPEQQHYLNIAQVYATKLPKTLTDFMECYKLQLDQIVLIPKEFSPHDVIAEAVGKVTPFARGRGLELGCKIESDIPGRIKGDPSRLCKIITLLISTAIESTKSGEIVLIVNLRKMTDSLVTLHFAVTKTGTQDMPSPPFITEIGKPPRRDWTNFYRETGVFGVGTGLNFVSCIVQMMNGCLNCEEERVGVDCEGSFFHFTADFKLSTTTNNKKKGVFLHNPA